MRSGVTLSGMTTLSAYPLRRQIIASEIPVFPDVGSRIVWPGLISAALLGILDEGARHAVLDGPRGVVRLELRPDADAGLR